MTQSWIRNRLHPETVPVRDNAWPEGHVVHIKDRVTAGDQAMARKLLSSKSIRLGDENADGAELAWYLGSLTSCAVMIVRVEGEKFTDPSTGQPLDFSGDTYDRLAAAQELPPFIVNFVGEAIEQLSAPPFGTAANESGSATASAPPSTRTSKPRSKKSGEAA